MLKAGDTVLLGCNPTVKVGEGFTFLKPYAVIRRTLSDDVLGDLKDMQVELRKLLFLALRREIEGVNDISGALGEDGDLDSLVAFCEKEIGDVDSQTLFQVEETAEGPTVEIDGEGNVVAAPKVKLKGGKKFPKKGGVKKKFKAKKKAPVG